MKSDKSGERYGGSSAGCPSAQDVNPLLPQKDLINNRTPGTKVSGRFLSIRFCRSLFYFLAGRNVKNHGSGQNQRTNDILVRDIDAHQVHSAGQRGHHQGANQ
jgi:hypothetical protein